jgi:hypothetical protein
MKEFLRVERRYRSIAFPYEPRGDLQRVEQQIWAKIP